MRTAGVAVIAAAPPALRRFTIPALGGRAPGATPCPGGVGDVSWLGSSRSWQYGPRRGVGAGDTFSCALSGTSMRISDGILQLDHRDRRSCGSLAIQLPRGASYGY